MSEKILIISDIHEAHAFAERLIAKVKPDKILILGDCLDRWNDNPRLIAETAKWMKWSLNQPNRIHLWGNHDLPYYRPCEATYCPGWDKAKHEAVKVHIGADDWQKMKFFHWEGDWLFTHAGFSARQLKPYAGDVAEQLKTAEKEAYQCLRYGNPHWMFTYGANPPGILWCRPNQNINGLPEFMPIEGVNQMFGHTTFEKPWELTWSGGQNWCIDTDLQYYAILEDGKMTIHETPKDL